MSDKKIPRSGEKPAYLTLLVGRGKEQVRVRMKDKGIVIGRNTKRNRVDFDTKPFDGAKMGVSREHLLIAPKKDYLYAQDLDSVNSTWLNKVRMQPMIAQELYHGDILHLGELRVEVLYTYADEVQEGLGETTQFGSESQAKQASDSVPEVNKATRVFDEDALRRGVQGGTKKLDDNPD